uniref:acyl-CoA dehydrogenase family protein n=1 Tax=uncultured Abyssibacter sp. TaxID=2320202 RepID=UPI0032B1BA29
MNFELSDDQQLMRDNFARFLDEHSSMARVRAAEERGFDAALWQGLGELGAFSLRVPEDADGLGMGVIDAAVLMEEAGRTLASGPLAETLIAARLLALLGGDANRELLDQLVLGESVVSLALHDASIQPKQWIAGGAVASAVIARDGDRIVLVKPAAQEAEGNLASTAIAEIDLADGERSLLSDTPEGLKVFAQGVEEWKLLIAAALAGLSRQALKMAAEYACERKAFGQPIGQYQAISHPMADLVTDAHGGKYLTWKTIHDIAHGLPEAAPQVSMTAWWNADTAARAVAHALHTFGGYGLTTEYDIYLYNLRAKAWPLVYGDPKRLLEEAGRRLYAGETAELPEVGEVPIDFDLGEEARNLGAEMDA